ncbi:hypothetical protein F0562_028985 [Nyssa sinensis]|uniref:WAT1-related protein n=1 Tax=Nyssa sinensis TaxID=561372 RepID=A0A5J5B3W4_9ASTE|nr:hypothetical protein F0562_028985 [Nyssa sinensis]
MASMGKICNTVHGLKPTLLMVVVQLVMAGMNIFYKLAANDGMSLRVLVAYRFLLAAAFIVPLALYVERKSRPKLTWVVVCQAFLCGLFGLERLGLGTMAGKAKVVGTLMGIGGAMLLTFYKGEEIHIWSTHLDLLHQHGQGGHVKASQHPESGNRALGAFLVVCSCFSCAVWLIIQGILASGLMYTLTAWCVRMRGPLFASIFSPLMLILVAIAGSLVLDEKLHLGTIFGAILIVCGLYMVLWGKGKEMKRIAQLMPSKSSKESERIEIVLSSATENNSNGDSSGVMVVAPNNNSVSMATCDDTLDRDLSVKNKIGSEGEERISKFNLNV